MHLAQGSADNSPMQTSAASTRVIPRITFHHADRSAALEERARELAARLNRFHDRITGCRILIEGPSLHHAHGGAFNVSFDVTFPGGAIHASSAQVSAAEHADPYVALRDAFDNAKRQLKSVAASQ
jgi:ribosome-associated translation inhibitor RaiA